MWLSMPVKIRLRFTHVCPFRKSLAPPFIVFFDTMKLRQIERNNILLVIC